MEVLDGSAASKRVDLSTFAKEVKSGQRFEFGKNWRAFLSTLTDDKIATAEASIRGMTGLETLEGLTVLDIGSGSGLFSLAARRLGAKVRSFDYDPDSVGCTRELRQRYFDGDADWEVGEASVLDRQFIDSLGEFDIVYSWGVLHHTGDMWTALDNAAACVKPGGMLFIGIYNDEGARSRMWLKVKQTYCSGPIGKALMTAVFVPYFFCRECLSCVAKGENRFARYKENRGMSMTHDWLDWLGGLPFEVASVEALLKFYRERGFSLVNLKTVNDLGINELVMVRDRA